MASSTDPAIPDREESGVVGYRPGGCRNCLVLLLSAALIVVLIALIAVTALHSHTIRLRDARVAKPERYDGQGSSVCRSPDCVQLAALLLQNANLSADPCQDFFSYACGSYVANSRHDHWRTFTQTTRVDMEARLYAGMHQVLIFPELRRVPFTALKDRLSTFYSSCLRDENPRQPPLRVPWRDKSWLDLHFLLTGQPGAKIMSVEQIEARLMLYRAPLLVQLGPLDESLQRAGVVPLAFRFFFHSPLCSPNVRAFTRSLVKLAVQEMVAQEEVLLQNTVEQACRVLKKVESRWMMNYTAASENAVNATPAALIEKEEGSDPAFSLRRFFSSLVELKALTPDSLDRLVFTLVPGQLVQAGNEFVEGVRKIGASAFTNFATLHLMVTRARFMGREVQAVIERYIPDKAGGLLHLRETQVAVSMENYSKWQRCLLIMSSQLPALMTRAYVDEFLPVAHVKKVAGVAEQIRAAFAVNLERADWLEPADRAVALAKVESMSISVGYPDVYQDNAFLETIMADLNVTRDNFNWNYIRTAHMSSKWRLAEVAAGREEIWSLLQVPTLAVQAYYVPVLNHVLLTVGILQSPIIYSDIPEQFLLSGIGFVVGHEIGHAFDPIGHKTPFGSGRAVAWNISSLTEKQYHERLPCLEGTYSDMGNERGLFNLSQRTNSSLGNDLADLAGMRATVQAFLALKGPKKRWRLPGLEALNPLQTLLLHSVQLFCSSPTKRFYDTSYFPTHSPDYMRVTGPLRNVPAFARAFQCRPKTFMNPRQQCHFF